ncbi:2-dehydro-3-deoxy-D-gluconate 5-dehydrogenase KduD [Ahrensia kielensis]|uniref:2-dehydro-3-deoxy-D-gluconate 5-dehydrogenase KduD n=1 Tax=Ahrensia kielensis TaxID=76980 RepID=UPI00037976F9|nr:2-dehydro-3-deoxy-D-gluconate 5-dehydrogenase KduD [Ahrensia kielensis]
MNLFSLEGKRALVTGANTGIGQAIAVELARAGAYVLCAGRRTCSETVAEIEKIGASGESIIIDFDDPMAGVKAIEGLGTLDILVNNAGIIRRSDSTDFSEKDWDDVMDVNLKALFFTTQAFAKQLIARNAQGKVVNIASLLSFQGGIRVPSYTASKHGVAGVTKILANEWASKGINVNAIAPGYIATNNTEALRDDPVRSAEILSRIPAGTWGKPEHIAGTAVYLSSAAADYVHGAILNVDGGWLAR